MEGDLLGAWSAALAVWMLGGAGVCLLRLHDVWTSMDARLRLMMLFIAAIALSVGYHQIWATVAWLSGVWGWSFASWHGVVFRTGLTVGIVGLGGTMSWERCRHKGWLGLLAVGLAVGAGAFALA